MFPQENPRTPYNSHNDRTYFHGPPVANVLHQVVDFWASLFRMHWCALHPINALYADVTLIEKPKNKFTPKKGLLPQKEKTRRIKTLQVQFASFREGSFYKKKRFYSHLALFLRIGQETACGCFHK